MEYKGFGADIQYNPTAGRFDGLVTGASSDVTFTGKSISELETNFKSAVEKHISRCNAKHVDAYRTFSGNLALRFDKELHRAAFLASQREKTSVNKWIESAIAEKVRQAK